MSCARCLFIVYDDANNGFNLIPLSLAFFSFRQSILGRQLKKILLLKVANCCWVSHTVRSSITWTESSPQKRQITSSFSLKSAQSLLPFHPDNHHTKPTKPSQLYLCVCYSARLKCHRHRHESWTDKPKRWNSVFSMMIVCRLSSALVRAIMANTETFEIRKLEQNFLFDICHEFTALLSYHH